MKTNKMFYACIFFFMVYSSASSAYEPSFTDTFEAPTIDSFWSLTQQNGTIHLSTDTSHSGVQSVQMKSPVGAYGQKYILLSHTFSELTKGTVSVWFYDTGIPDFYAHIIAENSSNPFQSFYAIGIQDWDPSAYYWNGPTINDQAITQVVRSIGWHQFTLEITETGFRALIDQNVVGTALGNDFTFDHVQLGLAGPRGGSFDAAVYFDDFKFIPPYTLPTSKGDCKDGGWQHLVRANGSQFKNQGACVSYVNTGY